MSEIDQDLVRTLFKKIGLPGGIASKVKFHAEEARAAPVSPKIDRPMKLEAADMKPQTRQQTA